LQAAPQPAGKKCGRSIGIANACCGGSEVKRWITREFLGVVVMALGYFGVLVVWGGAAARRVLLGILLFAACAFLWEYKRHRRWEYLAYAAYAILFSAAFGALILAGEPHGDYYERYDLVYIVLMFAGLGCLCAGAIGASRRRSKDRPGPTIPEENSEGA
jgi:peptidoglycan/LPS O-acetylase OafA/YrhL